MRASAVYRRAAELIDSDVEFYACIAIAETMGLARDAFPSESRQLKFYLANPGYPGEAWLTTDVDERFDFDEKQIRILALLLMGEIAKDSEKKSAKRSTRTV